MVAKPKPDCARDPATGIGLGMSVSILLVGGECLRILYEGMEVIFPIIGQIKNLRKVLSS
jgi:hypothetical protein